MKARVSLRDLSERTLILLISVCLPGCAEVPRPDQTGIPVSRSESSSHSLSGKPFCSLEEFPIQQIQFQNNLFLYRHETPGSDRQSPTFQLSLPLPADTHEPTTSSPSWDPTQNPIVTFYTSGASTENPPQHWYCHSEQTGGWTTSSPLQESSWKLSLRPSALLGDGSPGVKRFLCTGPHPTQPCQHQFYLEFAGIRWEPEPQLIITQSPNTRDDRTVILRNRSDHPQRLWWRRIPRNLALASTMTTSTPASIVPSGESNSDDASSFHCEWLPPSSSNTLGSPALATNESHSYPLVLNLLSSDQLEIRWGHGSLDCSAWPRMGSFWIQQKRLSLQNISIY